MDVRDVRDGGTTCQYFTQYLRKRFKSLGLSASKIQASPEIVTTASGRGTHPKNPTTPKYSDQKHKQIR
jgi:hypothetical protein